MTTDTTPQLLLYTPNGVEKRDLVGQQAWTLGRHNLNDIQLPERSVSREHAKLERLQKRYFKFTDLNSSNGSAINDEPVSRPLLLKHGDLIRLGNVQLTLEHRLVLSQTLSNPQPSHVPTVLMVQGSAIQGIVWQEILLSQGISVQWEVPNLNLKQLLTDCQATGKSFPRLLLLDLQAYISSIEELCGWCQTHIPEMTILLSDSGQRQISVADRQWAQNLGCSHLLPAFRTPKLLDNVAGVVVNLNLVLQAFDNRMLQQHTLFLALNTLEELLKQFPEPSTKNGAALPQTPDLRQPRPQLDSLDLEEDVDITTISARAQTSRHC